MVLTNTFDIATMTFSNTARRNNIAEQYTPPQNVIDNLKLLHEHIIVPLVNAMPGELSLTCAYRCPKVNAMVGGKPNSQHVQGKATDLQYRENGVEMNRKIIDTVKELKLDFDQMIDERNLAWVHISYNHNLNRKQFLKL